MVEEEFYSFEDATKKLSVKKLKELISEGEIRMHKGAKFLVSDISKYVSKEPALVVVNPEDLDKETGEILLVEDDGEGLVDLDDLERITDEALDDLEGGSDGLVADDGETLLIDDADLGRVVLKTDEYTLHELGPWGKCESSEFDDFDPDDTLSQDMMSAFQKVVRPVLEKEMNELKKPYELVSYDKVMGALGIEESKLYSLVDEAGKQYGYKKRGLLSLVFSQENVSKRELGKMKFLNLFYKSLENTTLLSNDLNAIFAITRDGAYNDKIGLMYGILQKRYGMSEKKLNYLLPETKGGDSGNHRTSLSALEGVFYGVVSKK